jgi:Spy/CpxP family protein refolding chaperone
MKTGWKLLMVAGVVLVVGAGQVMAQRGPRMGRGPAPGRGPGMGLRQPPGGPMGPAGMLGPMIAQLDLTAEQRNEIRNICQQSRADANEVVKAVDDARAELHEAALSGANEEQIRAAAAKLGTALGNQAVLRAQTVAAVKAVLTPEQLQKWEELKATVPHSRQRPAGPGFGGGPRGLQARGAGPGGPAVVPHLTLEEMFKAADTNKDGALSLEELRAFQETARGNRGPWRQ